MVDRYSRPLLQVAFELQSRFYNISRLGFLSDAWRGSDKRRRHYAELSTLWLLGQYLGWMEILRREVQFLELADIAETRRLRERLLRVRDLLATDRFSDPVFQIYRSDQRAIGERMIMRRETETGGTRSDCLGYADFVDALEEPGFARWFGSLRESIHNIATNPRDPARLVYVQRALIELIDALDPNRLVFPDANERGMLPAPGGGPLLDASRPWAIARFIGDAGWEPFEEWMRDEQLVTTDGDDPSHRKAEESRRFARAILVVEAHSDSRWLSISGWAEPPRWVRAVRFAPDRLPLSSNGWRFAHSRARAREMANRLLERYDRPRLH